jgi:hypothetical protein
MRTTDIIQSLAATTERLGDLVGDENIVLQERQPHKLSTNFDEKDRLVTVYEQEMAELRANPVHLERGNSQEVGRLRTATRRFQDVLEEHRRLVQTAKSVTDRMIRTITDEVSSRERPVTGYDASATMRSHFAGPQRAVSLALNRVV